MTRILGISAFYHDSAAAILLDGEIRAAAQEERFTRIKHDASFPENAIRFVLEECDVELSELDFIAFYDKPFLKFERLLETYVSFAPRGFASFRMAIPVWLREKLFLKDRLLRDLRNIDSKVTAEDLLFGEHHLSHAASAFYPSPFEEAVILTMDGVGEWATTSVALGSGNRLEIVKEINFPHSIGLLYSAFTYYCGFKVNSGEYKLMGLAPYGEPRFRDLILEHLVDVKEDGSYRLNQGYFNYAAGLTMTNRKFDDLFGRPARKPEIEEIEQFHMDVAASIQMVTEEIVLKLTNALSKEFDSKNLCLAGGVALNCVANGKILGGSGFERLWIQPAAGDAGGAVGVAFLAHHTEMNQPRAIVHKADAMRGAYLGPEYDQEQIEMQLDACGAKYHKYLLEDLIDLAAQKLAENQAIGWFQGKMEFGPRALGGRSILGDPRSESMQKTLNLKVKYRESFRPFAPSVLAEEVSNWFELETESPYMLLVAKVAKEKLIPMSSEQEGLFGIEKLNVSRSNIPAVTHVDYSARVQTIHRETNPRYHRLATRFFELTGCPVLVNTSFNVRGEPIVCAPEDAFHCFMGTEIEVLVIGDYVLFKEEQNPTLAENYKEKYELD